MKPDLHCHSFYSDGKHSPQFLTERAIENGVSHLAITDHDCVTAFEDLTPIENLQLIRGVEISCDWLGKEIHVVGLGIDTANTELNNLLLQQQASRRQRMEAMHQKLCLLGDEGLMEHMHKLPCISYTRSHVADYLVERGLCKSRQKAFKQYLGKKGRIYIESQWCGIQQTISVIKAAGGISVLAHPGRYPLGKARLAELVRNFAELGGEALEASYGNIDPRSKQRLTELAEASGLYLSLGSDFHDREAHWTDIGKVPAFNEADKKNAIWNHPRWHFN